MNHRTMKIGITGLPGAGKTSSVIKVIEMLEREGYIVGGMITEPLVEHNTRQGFYVMDWMTKERGIFAHVNFESDVIVGRYGVNLSVLEDIGIRALMNAVERADMIVIDEIGKMEVESEKFVETVKNVLEVDKTLILTLHKKSRNPLLQEIRRRDDIRLLEVTPINKHLLPYRIMKLIRGELL